MITMTPNLRTESQTPLYMQLYSYIRDSIAKGHIAPGERLPSLRALSKELSLSITTVELSYQQLVVEGYIESRPQAGYFVTELPAIQPLYQEVKPLEREDYSLSLINDLYYDPACFDFTRWKKCMNKVLTDYSHLLFEEGELRGEASLRYELSKYIYQARGVRCTPGQIVIGAGTQQLAGLLTIILQRMGIDHAAFEEPGYFPMRSIFLDRNFKISSIPLDKDGIQIEKLPVNIRSTVYVSPSNQFPTGSVMPAPRRYGLLEWAAANNSIIIEDDYNSELRYTGRPVPSLQGLDKDNLVVYLGSFSSTLFPSVKISYMVLPGPMLSLFDDVLKFYTQTCSKTEQLTLALYMQQGFYQTNIRKLRKLNAQKLQTASEIISRELDGKVKILNRTSGLHMLLEVMETGVESKAEAETATAIEAGAKAGSAAHQISHLCEEAFNQGILLAPVHSYPAFLFYYNRIPLAKIEEAVLKLKEIIT